MTSGDVPATYTVTFSNNPTNIRAIVEDDRVTFDLNGHTYTTTDTSVALQVGAVSGRSGRLTVTDGTVVLPFESDVEIGSVAGASGVLTVGTGGLILGSPQFLVGLNGSGTLNVNNGGDVIADRVRIGMNSGSGGTVAISGVGSAIDAREVVVGFNANGTLNISAGGQVDNVEAYVAGWLAGVTTPSPGTVNVDGIGSTWDIDQTLRVGEQEKGTLNVTGGGRVMCLAAIVGDRDGLESKVNVSSTDPTADSVFDTRALRIGSFNTAATLTIGNGGVVNVAASTVVGNNGRVNLQGGTLDTSLFGYVFEPFRQQFFWTSGTLRVETFEDDLTVPSGGVLEPVHSLTGTTIEGAYNQQAAGATLAVEVFGSSPELYDRVTVQGAATLGGTLQLLLDDDFVPSAVNTFHILEAIGSITTSFGNVANGERLAVNNGLGSFVVNYGPGSPFNSNQVVLSAFLPGIPGDYNNDGMVNAADYVTWRDHLGAPASLPNDATPGVSIGDYAVWKQNFGATPGSGVTAAVPEPATLFLLCIGLITAVSLLRRRRIP
jgi:T5SS/PEP-CTERM-associated repeat protein